MSIISTLLTGVSIVGKVCQALSGAANLKRLRSEDGLEIVYEPDMTVGGATFYKSNQESEEGSFHDYVFNPTTMPISVCLPNINDMGGMEMLVMPKKARDLSLMITDAVPPDTEMMIGPVSEEDVADTDATANDTAIKLCVNRLPMDGTLVMIGGVTLKAAVKEDRLYVQATDSAIGSITYLSMTSERGISAEVRDVIYPAGTDSGLRIGVNREYEIPFKDMGFDATDHVGCRIYFSVACGNAARMEAHAKLCLEAPRCYTEHLKKTDRWQ